MSAEIIAIIGTNIVVVSVILTNMEAMCRRLESRLDVAATRENPKPSDASGGARGRPRALPALLGGPAARFRAFFSHLSPLWSSPVLASSLGHADPPRFPHLKGSSSDSDLPVLPIFTGSTGTTTCPILLTCS